MVVESGVSGAGLGCLLMQEKITYLYNILFFGISERIPLSAVLWFSVGVTFPYVRARVVAWCCAIFWI